MAPPKAAEVLPGEVPDRRDERSGDHAEAATRRLTLHRALLTLSPRRRAGQAAAIVPELDPTLGGVR